MADEHHRKVHPSRQGARRERHLLRLVGGPGVVPNRGGNGRSVRTDAGLGSLSDLLAETGGIVEAEARGLGSWAAQTLARLHADGLAHGDVKPANVVFAPTGELWLIDFDAAGAIGSVRRRGSPARLRGHGFLTAEADIIAVAVMVIESAASVIIDPTSTWTRHDLVAIGCPPDLAADCAAVLHDAPSAERVAGILQRRDDRLPRPPRRSGSLDPTPTVDIPSVALQGLNPLGGPAVSDPRPERRGWRRWATPGRG